jgi:hypothetical protein
MKFKSARKLAPGFRFVGAMRPIQERPYGLTQLKLYSFGLAR